MSAQPWTVSPSIERLKDRLRDEPVTTAEVLNALFEIHPEYGGGLAAKVRLQRQKGETPRYIDEILDSAREVWDDPPHLLHGRLLVVSLALHDPAIGQQLAEYGLLQALVREFSDMPPVRSSLEPGWNALIAGPLPPPPDPVEGAAAEPEAGRQEGPPNPVLTSLYQLARRRAGVWIRRDQVEDDLRLNAIAVRDFEAEVAGYRDATPPLVTQAGALLALTQEGVALMVRHAGDAPSRRPRPQGAKPGASAPPGDKGQGGGPGGSTPSGVGASERVPLHADHPASVDELGRRPFAEIIARRLEENQQTWARLADVGDEDADRAIMVGIHGPWGAGKSTVLNLLRAQLQADTLPEDDRWVVVEFNAWRNQRVRPPWWTLIQAVYAGSVRQIGIGRALVLRARWLMWRARADWLPAMAAGVFIAAAILLTTGVYNGISTEASGDTLGKAVELGLKIITAVFAAGAAVIAFSRSLLFGSSRAAQAYTEMRSSDPLRPIVRMFSKLVRAVGRPVAVFVDDLDRCDAKYVLELLEGMQTLFRTVPIAYVVAADRKWIAASFANGYADFAAEIGEPGRPLGYLFLDKLFQLSASLPLLSPERKRAYWSGLLRASGSADPAEMEKERKAAEARAEAIIGGASTHEALSSAIAAHDGDAVLQEGLRAVAAKRITSRKAEQETAHRLQRFDELLESNPRSMKRLVNAYGLHQAAQYIETGGVNPETLARWTIVELRWPLLAEFLAGHPAAVTEIRGRRTAEGVADALKPLLADDTLHAVLTGTGAGDPGLDEDAIRRILGRPPAPRPATGADVDAEAGAAGAPSAAANPASNAEIVQTADAIIAPQPAAAPVEPGAEDVGAGDCSAGIAEPSAAAPA